MSFITLTTDFGADSPYVAAMKASILAINPAATIVDITHSIPPQDVRQGAVVLQQFTSRFPAGTIHVAVVDPGVGSDRAILYAEFGDQRYIAPDNGLLSGLARHSAPGRMHALRNAAYWMPDVSATFHGRDIMAPAAAHLSLAVDPEELGPAQTEWMRLPWQEVHVVPGKIEGAIQSIDSFGNLVTDITADMLAAAPKDDSVRILCDDHETFGIWGTYADQPPMTLIALIGSSGFLELSIVNDSAEMMLGVKPGVGISVTW